MEENLKKSDIKHFKLKRKDIAEKRMIEILNDIIDKIKVFYMSGNNDYHFIITGLGEEGWILTKNPTIIQNRSNYKGWITFCQPLQIIERTNNILWACKKSNFNRRIYPTKKI